MDSAKTSPSAAKIKGKQAGIKNFQPHEDLSITKAYKFVTTDASVGTDQDSDL
jgi:hypothetical protein